MITKNMRTEIANMNLSQLNELQSFIQDVKVINAKTQLSVGDKVYVVQKTKKTLGTILKIKLKKAIVEMHGTRYNVPMSMLEAV